MFDTTELGRAFETLLMKIINSQIKEAIHQWSDYNEMCIEEVSDEGDNIRMKIYSTLLYIPITAGKMVIGDYITQYNDFKDTIINNLRAKLQPTIGDEELLDHVGLLSDKFLIRTLEITSSCEIYTTYHYYTYEPRFDIDLNLDLLFNIEELSGYKPGGNLALEAERSFKSMI
jgi:hypothetical protein